MKKFSPHRLRGHRDGVGRSPADLAAAVGRSPDALRCYETGRTEPPARVLAALADELGVDLDDLFARHDDPTLDYVDAVAQHCPPLTPDEVQAAAVVIGKMRSARLTHSGRAEPRAIPA
ncbi:MAG: helix-turn-helix domain-containing protein [Pseudonocardiaceae bacterium]|nr:MAG: helix-turn-helix domain-containing protein [Pseudonocardiaceae bacterium]